MEDRAEGRGAGVTSPHEELDYWGYQTCTEFGFYQTCEVGTSCFFTQGLDTLASMDSFCSGFGISQAEIAANIAKTNAYYGAGRPDLPPNNASRIMYINGDVDPWHGLSILKSPTATLPTIMVPGASHHAWTHPSAPTDQPTVVVARAAIRKQIGAWLGLPYRRRQRSGSCDDTLTVVCRVRLRGVRRWAAWPPQRATCDDPRGAFL